MSEENKALMRRWFEEVWNEGRAEAIPDMFADEGIAHGLSDDPLNPLRGPAGPRKGFKGSSDSPCAIPSSANISGMASARPSFQTSSNQRRINALFSSDIFCSPL